MIDTMPESQITAPVIKRVFGVRYAEDMPIATSGSLFDFPHDKWGTANWWPGTNATVIYYEGDADIAFALTGPAIAHPGRTYEQTLDSSPIDPMMSQLESAAQKGDERAFVVTQRHIDWQRRSPEDFIRAIQFALAAGAHLAARNLSALGAARFPNREDLQKYARVLAPPKVTRRNPASDLGWKANRDWLTTNSDEYQGRWVALRNGELVGSADTLKALSGKLSETRDLLLTKVY